MDNLIEYNWPGNVRELKNMIECLLMTENEGDILKILKPSSFPLTSASYKTAKKEAIKQFEIQYLTKVLQEEDWNIAKAAKRISLSREELHRKIKRLGIKKPN